MDRSGRTQSPVAPFILAAVLAVGLLCLVAFSMWMAHGGWNMHGQMGGMMGAGRNTSADAPVVGDARNTIDIREYSFLPGNLTIRVGASVTWTNRDSVPHNATAGGNAWSTRTLSGGESDSLTFATAGDYTYYCTIHPQMTARLSVR
jgi:plastocyanin